MSLNDWQKISVFDERVEWQKNLAIEVYRISDEIASSSGKKDHKDYSQYYWTIENLYKDDVVQIRSFSESDITPGDGSHKNKRTIHLVPFGTEVFNMSYYSSRSAGGIEYYTIDIFRIGSWLNHIESLRLKRELEHQRWQQRRDQEDAKRRRENFGRLN
jgi:hypothetical protein